MKLDEIQKLFESMLEKRKIDPNKFNQNGITTNIPKITQDIADVYYKYHRKEMPAILKERRKERNKFDIRHNKLWKEGIDLLESFLIMAFELGESVNDNYRSEATESKDILFDVLVRLQARTVHVGYEALNLLKGGFADGAHARWRTAHEISVISLLLSKQGNNIALKYLEHEQIEIYKAMTQFQEFADKLGQPKFTEQELNDQKRIYDELCTKYGASFAKEYGWAEEVINKRYPKFIDLEKASGLEHFRPYYKMACINIHANARGIGYKLGLPENSDLLLAGPSNYGLTDPAHGVALAILKATSPLLTYRINLDTNVIMRLLLKWVDDIGNAFAKVEKGMKEES